MKKETIINFPSSVGIMEKCYEYKEHSGAKKMFAHIKENQLFYNTYFKLCYDSSHLISVYDPKRAQLELDSKHIPYHIEFFRNELNAIIKLCLASGCKETPEEMAEILQQEYKGRGPTCQTPSLVLN